MSRTRVGLMGFGRIGRNVFRQMEDHPQLEIGAIADVAQPEGLAYLLKYDSIYGRFPKSVDLEDGLLCVNGREVRFLDAAEPGDADWEGLGIDIVVQATGGYRTRAWCERHLAAGARAVVLASTPEDLGDIPLLLTGVNDFVLQSETQVIALGSNTSNALAPVLQILDEAFGVDRAFFTTVHAFTRQERLADVPGSGFRSSRAAGENIIPSETNSPQILEHVMPSFSGKLSAVALNVPVPDGSTIDLVAELSGETTRDQLNEAVRSAVEESYGTVLEFCVDPIVSSDVVGSTRSGVFDSLATMVIGGSMAKCIVWFDNGWGYSARVVEACERLGRGKD